MNTISVDQSAQAAEGYDLKAVCERKFKGVLALRDYAIINNLSVPDKILEILHEVEKASNNKGDVHDTNIKVDKAIRDLTSITFPTTIDTILFQTEGGKEISGFRRNLFIIGVLALLLAIVGFSLAKLDTTKMVEAYSPLLKNLGVGLLGMSLGLLGAVVYVIFNLIGEWTEKVMNREDTSEAYLRVLLGPLVGWVFFFAFAQEAFAKPDSSSVLLLFPFLAGFSTKLVVGIINQALHAVQITLGLEDKASRLLARKAQSKLKGP
ncbi:MAG: hypothetical protein NTX45_22255 [Proteobacteria bacterium]|nr:hypothetical protein [Pseudomonadota bacterium]